MEDREHEASDRPMLMTSPGRMARGIIICAVTLAIGFAIVHTLFDAMFANPPPVTRLQAAQPPPPPPPAAAGVTQISILSGAAVQGNPDYDPDDAQVPAGNKVVWINADNVPHTATSGTGPEDEATGARFDSGIINGGEKSSEIEIKDAKAGETIPYYCIVHPYMTSQLTVTEAAAGGGGGSTNSSPVENVLTIPSGAAVQGNPSYDPAELTITQGKTVLVRNADNVPHTVTSGTGPEDANSGKSFDSSILDGGAQIEINTSSLSPGDYPYYCIVHPYMKGKLVVTE
ncbi:cupredoxin domain-containing protein [Nitrososphaera sp.]|uniref:cupredoxin domain-containing protein n=1 Tax=Nitrososphaera sp. TaxID=1971748 RepID=UPI00307D3ABA